MADWAVVRVYRRPYRRVEVVVFESRERAWDRAAALSNRTGGEYVVEPAEPAPLAEGSESAV